MITDYYYLTEVKEVKGMGLAPGFRKITPQRPVVVRKGDVVKVCYFYQGTRECFGPLCYWQRVGRCPIYEKLFKKKAK